MENDIATYFSDIVMEAPHAFSTDEKTYYIYPPSLGKLMLIQRQVEEIGVNGGTFAFAPMMEIINVVGLHRESCLRLLAFSVCKTKAECYDLHLINTIVEELSESLTDEDIATLLVYVLTSDKSEDVKKHYGIDKENESMSQVMRAKSQGGSLSFGGKTLLGTLIDQACERYGWTVDYVVWGISYSTLRLMMADRVSTLYLSEDERKKVSPSILQRDEEVIKASRETMAEIKSMNWR